MRSLEYRTGVDFDQALRCVRHRPPRASMLGQSGTALAVSLRYGLIGVAAIRHLLLTSSREEVDQIQRAARVWPGIAADHFCLNVADRVGLATVPGIGARVADLTLEALMSCLPFLGAAEQWEGRLEESVGRFQQAHIHEVSGGWNPFASIRAKRAFTEENKKSAHFAKCFYERRRFELPEVPEIALLGE